MGTMSPDDEEPEFKSIYDNYESHRMDYADMQQVAKGKRRAAAANKRLKKTGDARHPNTIRAEQKREYNKKLAESRFYDQNPHLRTNPEGDIVNPADFNACNRSGRSGSFSHGNNGCGCANCD